MTTYHIGTVDISAPSVTPSALCTFANVVRSECSTNYDRISSQLTRVLDDIRSAAVRDLEEARLSARRLVKLLESPRIGESCRGGLAPWQKRKIDRYIRENLAHPLERDRLAAQISLSTCHFSRAFKESFGESPHVYIIGLRLELAKELMLSTDESLSQIAFACGFADQSHFTKVFRRGLGETPHMWRRLNVTETKQLNRRLSSDLVTAVVTGGMTLVIEAVGQQSTWKQAARITAPRCATIMDTCHRAATDSPLLARGSGRG